MDQREEFHNFGDEDYEPTATEGNVPRLNIQNVSAEAESRSTSRGSQGPNEAPDLDGNDYRKKILEIKRRASIMTEERKRPPGATETGNQYKLLIAPKNRKFMSDIGLDPLVTSKLPTERKAVIKLFESLDDQQNGFVPVAKIDGYLKSAHLPIGKMDRKRIVQLCDTNGDGYVQKLDLVNALSKLDSMVSVNMCMPSKVARANHMVASMMVDTNSVIAAKRVGTEPRSPRDILQGWFAPKQRPQNISRHQRTKDNHGSRNPTIPNKNSAQYCSSSERLVTMSELAQRHVSTLPSSKVKNSSAKAAQVKDMLEIERLHKSKLYFNKLDRMQGYVEQLTARCRARDDRRDRIETARLDNKRRQVERYMRATLVGADLFDRLTEKRDNRLKKLAKSPHTKKTFDIFDGPDERWTHRPNRTQGRWDDGDSGDNFTNF